MPQPGNRLGLDPEPCQVLGPEHGVAPHHFQGDEPLQSEVLGLEDHAHSPFAQTRHDPVAGNRLGRLVIGPLRWKNTSGPARDGLRDAPTALSAGDSTSVPTWSGKVSASPDPFEPGFSSFVEPGSAGVSEKSEAW